MTFLLLLAMAGDIVLLDGAAINAAPPPGWTLMVKRPPVKVFISSPGPDRGVCLDANSASFSINREAKVDLRSFPVLRWTWRVDVLPPRGDFKRPATDDQAAQLFVVFERQGLRTRHAINYIWDTNARVGERGYSSFPLILAVRTLVVKHGSDDAGRWISIRRDVLRDHIELFGEPARAVEAVRFQVNSQHTGARAVGCLREVTFTR